MSSLLEVSSLSVAYGASPALSEIDLVVDEGSVVGILGANGAGKSTLLRTIAGLVRPASGEISFAGARIDRSAAHEISRQGICLIPEGRGILPSLSVGDNLRIAGSRDTDTIERALERFPVLRERTAQSAGTLSGGEQQMLAFARAFDAGVRLLLVDEPSLGLAPKMVDTVESTLRSLHTAGRTIVWVEQYASRVLGFADVIYILGRGRIVWSGAPSELRSSEVLVKSYLGGSQVG